MRIFHLVRRGTLLLLKLLPSQNSDTIRWHLVCVSLNDSPSYEALSYCWGDPAVTKPVAVGEAELQVTTNLCDALTHLGDAAATRTLWVDALCIYQYNIAERNAQVSIMQTIYRQARRTLAWLGKAGQDSALAFILLSQLVDVYKARDEAELLFSTSSFEVWRGNFDFREEIDYDKQAPIIHLLQRP
jgi:Heterokaryon incompatibility protein (HET)